MRTVFVGVLGLMAAVGTAAAERPVLQMRLRGNHTETEEQWSRTFAAIRENPGCCDEVWFSTGTGAPSLDWHRARAKVIGKGFGDLRAIGIVPSLQFQATLGHGDGLGRPEMFTAKTWTGWTGSQGVEDRFCNCPRHPGFLAYVREVSRIYAALKPAGLWIDDDLRYNNHRPATDGSRLGCWCATCIAAFNAETGGRWTRETLDRAMAGDAALEARWKAFAIESLCGVARAIGEEFSRVSPETMLALQQGGWAEAVEPVREILKTLHEVSGRAVGYRPGGGAYHDLDPYDQVEKSVEAARFRRLVGDPSSVAVWTPEIESWPRAYGSRSAQSAIIEGFTALMYGMNAVSFFISNGAKEDPTLYGRTYWKSLEKASPVLRAYARTVAGCRSVGFTMSGKPQIGIRRAAIPVLAGLGRSCGELTEKECALNVNMMTSAEVQRLRDDLDRRAGGFPAVVCSPFLGLMQVHVDAENRLAAVALVNTRISAQGPVRVKLHGLTEGVRSVTWRALGAAAEELPVERLPEGTFASIPEIGAWNAGYIDFSSARIGDVK